MTKESFPSSIQEGPMLGQEEIIKQIKELVFHGGTEGAFKAVPLIEQIQNKEERTNWAGMAGRTFYGETLRLRGKALAVERLESLGYKGDNLRFQTVRGYLTRDETEALEKLLPFMEEKKAKAAIKEIRAAKDVNYQTPEEEFEKIKRSAESNAWIHGDDERDI